METDNSNQSRPKWKWPAFSLRGSFVALSVAAAAAAVVGLFVNSDEQLPTLLGALVLGWMLFCWRMIRLNRNWFRLRR